MLELVFMGGQKSDGGRGRLDPIGAGSGLGGLPEGGSAEKRSLRDGKEGPGQGERVNRNSMSHHGWRGRPRDYWTTVLGYRAGTLGKDNDGS